MIDVLYISINFLFIVWKGTDISLGEGHLIGSVESVETVCIIGLLWFKSRKKLGLFLTMKNKILWQLSSTKEIKSLFIKENGQQK